MVDRFVKADTDEDAPPAQVAVVVVVVAPDDDEASNAFTPTDVHDET